MTTDSAPEPYFKVPAQLMQDMANYLSHQPYRDVAPMLNVCAGLMPTFDPQPIAPEPESAPPAEEAALQS